MTQRRSYFNWSGGKDSALALFHARKDQATAPDLLLTSINATFQRVSMHGVRRELLDMQADMLGLPLRTIELPEATTMPAYNALMSDTVARLKAEGYTDTFFGDIFLEDLRVYREEQLRPFGITAHFPIWKRDTKELLHEFLDLGFKTIVVCIKSELLDKSFAGRMIDHDFIKDLPSNVDPCGENGEFHTFVYDGPIFKAPVRFDVGEVVYKEYARPKDDNDNCFVQSPDAQMGFWFCDLSPVSLAVS